MYIYWNLANLRDTVNTIDNLLHLKGYSFRQTRDDAVEDIVAYIMERTCEKGQYEDDFARENIQKVIKDLRGE